MDSERSLFETQFRELTGHDPFPWQGALYEQFLDGRIPNVADLPTGLGKTSVIAVWLLALLKKPDKMPRRLVYVVNRRTVVDQTTAEVERLRERLPKLGDKRVSELAISTLRGQFADNEEWAADPSRTAVICGTVDMIGSRLLFEGYRIGRGKRPLHAGFLGQDALLVHDEAHLEPAFQKLIETIQCEQGHCRGSEDGTCKRCGRQERPREFRPFHVMALSATSRSDADCESGTFGLKEPDLEHPIVKQRISAVKALHLHLCSDEKKKLGEQVAELALQHRSSRTTVLVFVRAVKDVAGVVKQLKKNGASDEAIQTLTGTMRGLERDRFVDHWILKCFLRQACPLRTVYLVCTSAGEVGVNLSADHMVCDLPTFDSMAQRLGRVNRFGERDDTRVDVVHPAPGTFDEKHPHTPARRTTLGLLHYMDENLEGNLSPQSLSELSPNQRLAAFAPEPTILPATDILFDAWAMTSIRGKMPGRPPVAPYLHGVADWEPSRISVAWREEVDVIDKELLEREGKDFPQRLLDDYPLKTHETLTDRADRVLGELQKIENRMDGECPVWVVDANGVVQVTGLKRLLAIDKKRALVELADCTLLLPPRAGGLKGGLLDGKSSDATDVADEWRLPDDSNARRRVRQWDNDQPPPGMTLVRSIDTDPDPEEFATDENAIDGARQKPRIWWWFSLPRSAPNPTLAAAEPVTWTDHTNDVVRHVTAIADRLGLPPDLRAALILAAELHDLGKQRELWQRSIGNPNPTDWHAKPGKPAGKPRWRPRRLSEYRHEFGSLLDILSHEQHLERLDALEDPMRDLVLHLIAAHHGRARPHFTRDEAVDSHYATDAANAATIEVTRRYARLQRRYGRWGLAYLESLLRAADWAASANPSPAEVAS